MNVKSFIWSICDDVLRGIFKRHEYGDVILPFLVLRRLDCVLESNKDDVIKLYEQLKNDFDDPSEIIHTKLKINFSNHSKFDLKRIVNEPSKLSENLYEYLRSYSTNVQDIIQNFGLQKHIEKLEENDSLYILIEKFTQVNLHPNKVDNHLMGSIFEELLRKFSEMSNETSGEHYTPRDIVNLLVNLVFAPDKEKLKKPNKILSIYDPCCGTGGMLTIGKKWIKNNFGNNIDINMFGQELNPQTYSICKSDFLITEEQPNNIKLGSTLSKDGFKSNNRKFDYMISNPPYGVSWKKDKDFVLSEFNENNSRFKKGLPSVRDGQFLFLQHMISKFEPTGSRIGIVFNGSPMFNGDAGSGESEIRKWIIENDWLETIICLPENLFFNTGITTYIWIVTNKKETRRKGKIQLLNGENFFQILRKKLNEKRKEITQEEIEKFLKIYSSFEESKFSKIFSNEDFLYKRVKINVPLEIDGQKQIDKNGNFKPDKTFKDYERIPSYINIDEYFNKEVKPSLPDAWMDRSKDKDGYEINFRKYFYKYSQPRNRDEIKKDLINLEKIINQQVLELL